MEAISSQDSASRKRKRSVSPPPSSDLEAGCAQRTDILDLVNQFCTPPCPPLSPVKMSISPNEPVFKVPLPPKRLVLRKLEPTPIQATSNKPRSEEKDGGKKKRKRRLGRRVSKYGGKLDHKLIRKGAEIELLKRDFFREKGLTRVEIFHEETSVILANSNCNKADMTFVKIFTEMENDGRLKDHECFAIETGILKYARHPNIISLGSVIQCPDYYAITLPYYPGGNLLKHLENIQDTDMVVHYFTQICEALRYLHVNRILHGDVKLENVLIQNGGNNVVLTNFSHAHLLPHDSSLVSSWKGSNSYIGPEFSEGNSVCGFKMESFSVGVLLWYLAIRDNPELRKEVFSLDLIHNGWPAGIDAFIRKLLFRLLTPDPTKRGKIRGVFKILNERKPVKHE